LERIADYLKKHHPSLTQPTIHKLYDAANSLKQLPNRGRAGREEGTRELVIAPLPYIIVYQVDDEVVHILRLLHASRERP